MESDSRTMFRPCYKLCMMEQMREKNDVVSWYCWWWLGEMMVKVSGWSPVYCWAQVSQVYDHGQYPLRPCTLCQLLSYTRIHRANYTWLISTCFADCWQFNMFWILSCVSWSSERSRWCRPAESDDRPVCLTDHTGTHCIAGWWSGWLKSVKLSETLCGMVTLRHTVLSVDCNQCLYLPW